MARMPKGAVASMLEKEATKNTIFFEDFTLVPFDILSRRDLGVVKRTNRSHGGCLQIVNILQNPRDSRVGALGLAVPRTK